MQATIIPTMGFYNRYARPLKELGYNFFDDARNDGLLNQSEYNLCIRIIGRGIPNENEMKEIIDIRIHGIRWKAI